jgi:pyruvate formate lyase activating enzyme
MIFGGLQQISLIDYPGKICAIIFTTGCNFRCKFCYNKEIVLPELIQEHVVLSESDILDFLKSRVGKLEAVCVTGGEPTLHTDLKEFLSKIKELGFLIKLDTNGTNPCMIKELIDLKLIDYIAMDIKAPLEEKRYKEIVGVLVDMNKIEESIKIIKSLGNYEFRTTMAPGLKEEDILSIVSKIGPAKKYFLQEFKSGYTLDEKYANMEGLDKKELAEIKEKIKDKFETVDIR